MGIIDVHSHPAIELLKEAMALEAGGSPSGEMKIPVWSAEDQLEVMDANGIGLAMLSLPEMGAAARGEIGKSMVRRANETLAEIVAKHPSRFGALAAIPMDDMDSALEETAYALDVLNMHGLGVCTHFDDDYLGEPRFDPWFEELNRRGATMFVHPVAPVGFDAASSKYNVSVLDFMFDTTRMITTLVYSGAKAKFPNVNIISTHGGGTIPYLANRIELVGQMPWAYRGMRPQSISEIHASLSSFYFDLTAATSPAQLDALLHLVSPERLLLGTDYPLMPPQTIAPAFAAFESYQNLDASQKDQIRFGNARKLFPGLATVASD